MCGVVFAQSIQNIKEPGIVAVGICSFFVRRGFHFTDVSLQKAVVEYVQPRESEFYYSY